MRSHYYDDATWKRPDQEAPQSPSRTGAAPRASLPGVTPFTDGESRPAPPPPGGLRRRTPDVREGKKKGRRAGLWIFLCCFALLAGVTAGCFFLPDLLDRLPGQVGDPPIQGNDPGLPFGDDRGFGWTEDRTDDWTALLEDTALPAFPAGGELTLELREEMGETMAPAQIYEEVNPSVVGVRTIVSGGVSTGTGVILSEDGYIVTNAHVIAGGRQAAILFPNNYLVEAALVGYDRESDLAVLKINAKGLSPARFGDSGLLRVGDVAYAIGNPLGEQLRGTMTDGIISAIDRPMSTLNGDMTLIQTTAALNPGNSGGALVNAAGEIVGITNMKLMDMDETIEGLGFAIPSTLVRSVVQQIVATGSYAGAPMLGITVTDHFAEDGAPDGAQVVSVVRSADAYRKLWAADVILAANGEPVTCTDDLLKIKNALSIGDELRLTVRLDLPQGEGEGQVEEITITLMSDRELADSSSSEARRSQHG